MKKGLQYAFLASFLISACQPAADKKTNRSEEIAAQLPAQKNLPAYFNQVLQAHGGQQNWYKLGAMQYQVTRDGNTEIHIIDLKNRKSLIKANTYSIGQNGEQVWVSPEKAAFPGKSARFYHNLYFYFYAIPFVLADPGGNYEKLQNLVLAGKSYEVIQVTFGEGVGDSPDDQYRLLINPDTNRLEWLLYTVTYFGGKPGEQKFNALKYSNYQKHQGLLFPKQLIGYTYEKDKLGEERYRATFENLQLKEGQPDQRQFEMPEKAEVDSLAN